MRTTAAMPADVRALIVRQLAAALAEAWRRESCRRSESGLINVNEPGRAGMRDTGSGVRPGEYTTQSCSTHGRRAHAVSGPSPTRR